MKNYYQILDIEKDAAFFIIKKAYKQLAKKHHPDLNKDIDSQANFIEITEAYKVLSDPFERIKYDQLIDNKSNNNVIEKKKKSKTPILFYYKYFAFTLLALFVLTVLYNYVTSKNAIEQDILTDFNIVKSDNLVFKESIEVSEILGSIKDSVTTGNSKLLKLNKEGFINDNSIIVNDEKAIENLQVDQSVYISKDDEEIVLEQVKNLPLSGIEKNNTDSNNVESIKDDQFIKENLQNKEEIVISNSKQRRKFNIYSNTNNKSERINIEVNNMEITCLQSIKGGDYKIPKKAKKTDSFKVNANFLNASFSKTQDEIEIMLVIKNDKKQTIKIDTKSIIFNKNENRQITFYEKFKDRLIVNEKYHFYFYVNRRLLIQTETII